MSKEQKTALGVLLFFFALTLVFFRQYFFSGRVPLPFNLLASFYSPWKYERWQGYESGVPNKPLGFDNIKLFYPYRKFTTDELKRGRWPLWNPYVFSGNVHHASYQSSVFYPLGIVYFLFPQADAWSILVMMQPVLAGFFLFLFLRSLSLSVKASLFGAVAYAFSGWMISVWEEVLVMEHSILWLPLALWASTIMWKDKRYVLGSAGLITALAMSVLAGFLQMTIYVYLVTIIWNSYLFLAGRKQKHSASPAFPLVFSLGVSVLVTAVQWIPALESYLLSPRGKVNAVFLFQQFLTPIHFLATLVAPDFWGNPGSYNYFSPVRYIQERVIYIGIFPLLFVLYELFAKTAKEERFWKIFSLAAFSLGLALPTGWLWYALKVPILSVAQPARIFAVSSMGMCIVAAYGFERYLVEKRWKGMRAPLVIVSAVLAVLWVFAGAMKVFSWEYQRVVASCIPGSAAVYHRFCVPLLAAFDAQLVELYARVSLRNLFIPTVLVMTAGVTLIFLRNKKILFLAVVYVASIASSLYLAQKILYFSDRQFEYPTTAPIAKLQELSGLNRVWSYGDAHMLRNIPSYFNLYSVEGYDALFSYRYGELLHSIQTFGKMSGEIYRTDAVLGEAEQNELMTHNPNRLRVMSLLGVKYILEAKIADPKMRPPGERFPSDLFALAWENDTFRIWEYKKVLPRAFVAGRYVVSRDRQRVADLLYSAQLDLGETVILDREPTEKHANAPKDSIEDTVVVDRYDPGRVSLTVKTSQNGFVFLSDTYYPGWVAFVDGIKTTIYQADYAFRAVQVRSGTHTVEFVYQPSWFTVGLLASGIGLGLSAVVFAWAFLQKRKR